jgi:hypothetical protein
MRFSILARRATGAWLAFWFPAPAPRSQFALLRIGTALILLYALFVRSFDLDADFAEAVWSNPATRAALDPVGWPFSLSRLVQGAWWLWGVHVAAMLIAGAFLAGVWTPVMAALSLLLQLSYLHFNPAMASGLDGLLIVALAYLMLVPSGSVLGVFARQEPELPLYPPYLSYLNEEARQRPDLGLPWIGLPVRMLQLHLSAIYLHSALTKLSTDWLAGTALWHPRVLAVGALVPLETLHSATYLTTLITAGLLLFELYYAVLIWVRPLRYPLLAIAVLVHFSVGLVWGLLPFNLLMIVLNLAFVPPRHLEAAVRFVRPLLVLPWIANDSRD